MHEIIKSILLRNRYLRCKNDMELTLGF